MSDLEELLGIAAEFSHYTSMRESTEAGVRTLAEAVPRLIDERNAARAQVAYLQGIIDAHQQTIRELRAALAEGER